MQIKRRKLMLIYEEKHVYVKENLIMKNVT
jgi:hypothetical protein